MKKQESDWGSLNRQSSQVDLLNKVDLYRRSGKEWNEGKLLSTLQDKQNQISSEIVKKKKKSKQRQEPLLLTLTQKIIPGDRYSSKECGNVLCLS